MEKPIEVDGTEVLVSVSTAAVYWSEGNACPGLRGNWLSSSDVADDSGIDIKLGNATGTIPDDQNPDPEIPAVTHGSLTIQKILNGVIP